MSRQSKTPQQVLLVVAHPDDESMFFAPALTHFNDPKRGEVSVLCLSNGDADGEGTVREKELLAACAILQVPSTRVTIVNRPELRDGMTEEWPEDVVASVVEEEVRRRGCNTVLTFDEGGVSDHLNHKAVHRGVSKLLETKGWQIGVRRGWKLATLGPMRKFASVFDLPLSHMCAQRGSVVLPTGQLRTSLEAMRAHKSQWVWFRKLFVVFSSYTYVNTLKPMAVL